MSNLVSTKAVQHGLTRQNTGRLQSLWIEFPGYCNLSCAYCYACGGEKLRVKDLMTREQYTKILDQAVEMGVDSIGIPGAGEPFIGANKNLTMWFLRECASRGIFVTLFTTGQFLTPELVTELHELPVEIMLKGNTLDADLQDRFVSDPKRGESHIHHGYGEARNRAIQLLMDAGFNDETRCLAMFGRKSRMALVTSIMTKGSLSNYDDMVDLLRFCRDNNILFDVDTVLERGRGASCKLNEADSRLAAKLQELHQVDIDEYGIDADPTTTYYEVACDRYMHHLYINQYGQIRPCIGATRVNLGNIRKTTLGAAWNSTERCTIRSRKYHGKCGDECQNFAEGKCHSCLGRRTKNLTGKFLCDKGFVQTTGCWNFRQKESDSS